MAMHWLPIERLSGTRFGWKHEGQIDHLDPQVAWADGTRFKGYGQITPAPGPDGKQLYPFLVEFGLGDASELASLGVDDKPFETWRTGIGAEYASVYQTDEQ